MRAALIPVKELAQAKMRLADVLDRRERNELALAMLTDVIAACQESGCFDTICVVSSDGDALRYAGELRAMPVAEPAAERTSSGVQALNDGLDFARSHLARRVGADEIVILPADIPLIAAADVRAIVEAFDGGDGRCVTIIPSTDNGTNALALRPPDVIPMLFGANSARAHRQAAIDAGVEPVILELENVRFDVDAPDDLRALEASHPGAATSGWLDARAHHDRARQSSTGR